MKLSLGTVVFGTLLLGGCQGVEVTFDDPLGFLPVKVRNVENSSFDVCVDGADQPHGTLEIENRTESPIDMGFVTTGRLKTTAADSTLRPSSFVAVRTEMLGPLPEDTSNVGTITILDVKTNLRIAGPFVGVIAVDVRAIEIEPLEWDSTGRPSIVLFNPSPFATKVRLTAVGRWFTPEEETELPPKQRKVLPLTMAGPAILPRRIAAVITIEGSRCSTSLEGELPKIEIPSDSLAMADRHRSTTHLTMP